MERERENRERMGKWREGEKWRERFTPSPCLLFLTIASPFSHSLAIFSLLLLILSLSPLHFLHLLSIFLFSRHFLSLPLHFLIFSLSIFSFFLYLLSIFSFSRHFLFLFPHSLSLHFLILFLSPRHFLSPTPFPHFFSIASPLALLMPNCLNKDAVFIVLLFAGRLNLRHLSRASQKS